MSVFTSQIFLVQLAFAGVLMTSDNVKGQETSNIHKSLEEIAITVESQNITLKDAFDLIHNKTGLTFAYINSKIPLNRKVNITENDTSLKDVLLNLSKEADLSFQRVNNRIQVSKRKKGSEQVIEEIINFQTRKVSGQVTDTDGQAIPGVNVILEGTSSGTVTDLDGNYTLEVPLEGAKLTFSAVGYTSQGIDVGNKTIIDVLLEENIASLEEVVITALGIKREERKLGYAVSEVPGDEVAKATLTDPIDALQGKAPGVQINTTSGGTFAASRITLRGNATFGKNTQPIFIIDGVIMENDVAGAWGNQIKNLNSDDFESISVLKGAAATALYGSRALHGVILITTKSGKKGSGLGVSVSETAGIRKVYRGPDFQNDFGYGPVAGMFSNDVTNGRPDKDKHDNQQFAYYEQVNGEWVPSLQHNMSEENAASWGPRLRGQDYIDYDGSMAKWVPQPDNYKDLFETGSINNFNVAVEGGGERNSFRISYTNFMDKGVNPRNDFYKNSISVKGTHELIKKIATVGASMLYTNAQMSNPPAWAMRGEWFHDGFPRSYDLEKWRNNYKDVDGGVPYPTGDGKYMYTKKSVTWFSIFDQWQDRIENTLLVNAYLDINIAKGLKANFKANVNQFGYRHEDKRDATSLDRLSNASYSLAHGQRFQTTFSGYLSYENNVSDNFSFDVLLGAETWSTESSFNQNTTRRGFKVRQWYNLKNSFESPYIYGGTGTGLGGNKMINSIYSFLNFEFWNTLYLSVTGRNDWSSALVYPDGSGNNSYFYPSASLSWVVNESINLPESIFAKLRVSYAMVGNDTSPYNLSTGFVTQNFNEEPTMALYKFENSTAVSPNLRPEIKRSFEAGFNVRFMNGRAGIDLSYYKDNTHDQIIPLTVPSESGITKQLINAGNLQNQGVEIMIDGTPVQTTNFSWDLGFAYTHNRDKIIDLYPGVNEVILYGNPSDAGAGTATYAYVGGDYGVISTFEGYKYYDGANAANHDIPVLSQRNNWSVAYMNGRQNMDSLVRGGNMQPDWYGSVNTTLSFKGFRLHALFDMSFGGDISSGDYRYGMHQGVLKNSLPNRDAENGGIVWTSEGMGNNYAGKEYQDGYIPNGVFPDGTVITFKDRDGNTLKQNDVGGMTYQQAYDNGLVEPTHWSGYIYRWTSASTGTPIMGWLESSWVVMRELSLSYDFPSSLLKNIFINSASLSIVGRDLGFIYNSLPDHINPTITNNAAGNAQQYGSSPFVRSVTFGLKFTF